MTYKKGLFFGIYYHPMMAVSRESIIMRVSEALKIIPSSSSTISGLSQQGTGVVSEH